MARIGMTKGAPTTLVGLAGKPRECAVRITELVQFQTQPLKHRNIEFGEVFIALSIECQMLAVMEAATGQQDGKISGVVTAGIPKVGAEQDKGLVEQ